jgi:acyl-CoA thioesterase FadM
MGRNLITLPERFIFSTTLAPRITDINYGGHLGNDSVLSLLQEARVRFLRSHGWGELDFGGAGLIMSDAAVNYLAEILYGDLMEIEVGVTDIKRAGFSFVYRVSVSRDSEKLTAVIARTGMVCYDYRERRVRPIPEAIMAVLQA